MQAMTINQLFNLECKLTGDPELYGGYSEFMNEYLTLDHMKKAKSPGKYFIPHYLIVKCDQKVSKLE